MTQNSKESATVTVEQAHKLIGSKNISRAALYNAIERNELPHIRLGRRILIPREALTELLYPVRTSGARQGSALDDFHSCNSHSGAARRDDARRPFF